MWDIVFLIGAFVGVVALSYFLTKKIAIFNTKRLQSKNMKVLETLQLGMNQYLHLVQIGEKVVVVGIAKEGIRYLCEVDKEEIDLSSSITTTKGQLFEHYLEKWKEKSNK